MGRRGAPGLGVQVKKALKSISGRGISKHKTKQKYMVEQKARGERVNPLESPLIHSDSYRKNVEQTAKQFLKWARQQGLGAGLVKDFKMQEAGRRWFEERISKGIKDLRTEAGHLKKLERGIEKAFGTKVEIVPKNLGKLLKAAGYPTTRREKIAQQMGYRRYTPDEVREGLEHVSQQRNNGAGKAQALEGQARLGFRLREAVSLRVSHVDLERNHIYVCEGQKGTRTRFVPIPEDYRPSLEKLVAGKAPEERVFDVPGKSIERQMRNLQRAWERACRSMNIEEHRTHNLRAYYACERLDELKSKIQDRDPGLSEKEADQAAREVLIEELGHSDTSKLAHYVR